MARRGGRLGQLGRMSSGDPYQNAISHGSALAAGSDVFYTGGNPRATGNARRNFLDVDTRDARQVNATFTPDWASRFPPAPPDWTGAVEPAREARPDTATRRAVAATGAPARASSAAGGGDVKKWLVGGALIFGLAWLLGRS